MASERELEEALRALDKGREDLEARMRDAQNRRRFCKDPAEAAQAAAEEKALLKDLDHLMTRYRALEGRLMLARTGQKRPW